MSIDSLKDEFLTELWMPIIIEAASSFYPRKRNKNMKLFTLTNGTNFNEISKLEGKKIIQRSDAVAWVNNMNVQLRLETEYIGVVLRGRIERTTITDASSELHNYFPREILNLDFSSQEDEGRTDRCKVELECMEKVVRVQHIKNGDRFTLIHTTILDSNDILRDRVKQISDSLQMQGYGGLDVSSFPDSISDTHKTDFVREVIIKICQKYKYNNTKINQSVKVISANQKILSIAGIFTRI